MQSEFFLPDDVALCILDHVYLVDALHMMALSTRFRSLVMAHPIFWEDLDISRWTPPAVRLFERRLERSAAARVSIHLHIDGVENHGVLHDVCNLVASHLSHVGSLHICGIPADGALLRSIFNERNAVLPMLRSLHLQAMTTCRAALAFPEPISAIYFPGPQVPVTFSAPLLRTVALEAVRLSGESDMAQWCHGVTHLALRGIDVYDWPRIRELFPALVQLDRADQGTGPRKDPSSSDVPPGAPLSELILHEGVGPPNWVLQVTSVTMYSAFHFGHVTGATFSGDEPLGIIQDSTGFIIMGQRSQKTRILRQSAPSSRLVGGPCLTANLFAAVVSLELVSSKLTIAKKFFAFYLPLTVLETLVIHFAPDNKLKPPALGRCFSCPALKRVRLTSTADHCQIDVKSVSEMLEGILYTHTVFPVTIETEGVELCGRLEDVAHVLLLQS